MVRVILVIREPGRLKIDYSLEFDLPEVPNIGSYVSIQRPDKPEPYGEDLIVRQVWWRLNHPETGGISSNAPKIGRLNEIFVECDPAIGPYSSDRWLEYVDIAKHRGGKVPEFELERFSVRESELKK